ncbi:MAG: aspartate/glutamate racemase family protein [Candidatus Aminicenantales bacterium]
MKKTIGILGGMGPEATAYFFELLIKKTKVEKDQDHIPVIIWNNPRIPPRTDAILNRGPTPVPMLVEGVRRLRQAGADFIVIPCVTAHYYLDEVLAQEKFSFLNILVETVKWAKANLTGLKKVGLLSSTGTLKSKLFHNSFQKEGIAVIEPTSAEQQQVMEAIFGKKGIKAGFTKGKPRATIVGSAHTLIERGAQAIIAGCTEVPLVLRKKDIPVPLLEPMSITAEAAIQKAGYELRNEKRQI